MLEIKAPSLSGSETVYVKASDNFQTGVESNWTEVIKKALRLYIDELKGRIK